MIGVDQRHEFQIECIDDTGRTILVGGRQVGKTETIVGTAANRFKKGYGVGLVTPRLDQTERVVERLREEFENQITRRDRIISRNGSGSIVGISGQIARERIDRCATWETTYSEIFDDDVDCVVVDEANYIDEGVLMTIDRTIDDVLYTITPAPRRTVVEIWAQHSPFHETWQVGATEVDHIRNQHLRDFDEQIDDERTAREIDASLNYE